MRMSKPPESSEIPAGVKMVTFSQGWKDQLPTFQFVHDLNIFVEQDGWKVPYGVEQ